MIPVSNPSILEREMSALEAQLRSSVKLQMEKTSEGIRSLSRGQDRLREAGESMQRVLDLCRRSEGLIENYPFIKQVSRTRQNFVLTKRVYEEFCALEGRVERCAGLLEADQESGRPDNLLLAYHYINRLEEFRNQTLSMMNDAPSTAIYTIKRYFKKLDDLINAFEDFFWQLPRKLFSMAGAGESSHIVYMVKVLHKMDGNQKDRFSAILDDIIAKKFMTALNGTGKTPSEDPSGTLEALSFWLPDLLLIREKIFPCFPPSMNIMDFFILTYHRNFYHVIQQCMATKIGPADILYVMGWVRQYQEDLSSQLGIAVDDLEPKLLDDRENFLIAEYASISAGKINEWIGNLLQVETRAFTERPNPPDIDADDHYMTPGGIDLYQIVKQHIDTAAQASTGRLLLEIIAACVKSVNTFLHGMQKVMEVERIKYLENPDGVPPHFESFVIMLGNTCLKWVSLVTDLAEEVEGMLASEYVNIGGKILKGLGEGFVGVAKVCSQCLVGIIFQAVHPAVQVLFTNNWYSGEPLVETIVATFDDFFKDYQRHADDLLLNKLVGEVLERFCLIYMRQMRAKSARIKLPQANTKMESDLATVATFFSNWRPIDRTRKTIDPLAKCVNLISSSQRMIFLEFVAVWKVYPDIPLSFLEDVLQRRDDLDKSAVKEIMEGCRNKTKEEKIIEAIPSIFSKLKS